MFDTGKREEERWKRRVDRRIGRGECRGNGMDTIILIVTMY
jgi:hypothetical protein